MEMLSQSGKGLGEAAGEGARSKRRQGGQQCGGARQVPAQLIEQHVGAPEEHAGIPIEIAGLQIAFGLRELGLFVEAANLQGFHASRRAIAGEFHVAVAGFRPARLNSDHHQVPGRGGLEGCLDDAAVLRNLADHVVGREDAHDGVGVAGVEDLRRQPDGRRGVALHGLGQNLISGDLGKLLNNDVAQVVVGQHPQALGSDQRRQAVHRGLNQAALANHVEHLFGGASCGCAARSACRVLRRGSGRNDVGSCYFSG